MKKEKGVTLIALIVTIVVMVIIASMAIKTGLDSLDETELQGFYTQLDIIQKKVDEIAITNQNYNSLGTALTSTQRTNLQNILNSELSGSTLSPSLFRYFTVAQLESILGLSDMDYAVFIHFDSRTVVAEKGITIKGITYHVSNSTTYYVNSTGSTGEVSRLSFKIISNGKEYYYNSDSKWGTTVSGNTVINTIISNSSILEENNYKITVTPINKQGNKMKGGSLKYKKTTSKYWETATGLEFIISDLTQYNVQYEDNDRNKVTVTIRVSVNSSGVPSVTIIS